VRTQSRDTRVRHHALSALKGRNPKAADKAALDVAMRDVLEGASCEEKRDGVRVLIEHGRNDEAAFNAVTQWDSGQTACFGDKEVDRAMRALNPKR
jgi:hypothetical protein